MASVAERKRRAKLASAFRLIRETPIALPSDRATLRGPREVFDYLVPFFATEPVECFCILALDAQHRLLKGGPIVVTRGILNSTLVHPREVFLSAIVAQSAAIVLTHNHPSGDPTPSVDDRLITDQMVAAGRLLDIPVHDHVIVGAGKYVSFAEAGLL